jgi:hypothetical protein
LTRHFRPKTRHLAAGKGAKRTGLLPFITILRIPGAAAPQSKALWYEGNGRRTGNGKHRTHCQLEKYG